MKTRVAIRVLTAVAVLAAFNPSLSRAAEDSGGKKVSEIPIRISYQPAFWALPWFIASDKGWWAKVGLKPSLSMFAAGAAQVAAGASGSWDVGGAGDIPAVLGAAKYGLLNIAISDKEGAILSIVASSPEAASRYKANPSLIAGKDIPATLNSNGERVAVACLDRLGAKPGSYRLVNLAPAAINSAVISKRFDLAAVWAPNTYILESAIGAQVMCTGVDVGLDVTGRLFVTPTFAKENPEAVARFLALYQHAVEWQKRNRQETLEYLKKFYETVGIKFPDKYLPYEVKDHPFLTFAEQLQTFKRDSKGESEVHRWSNDVAQFMVRNGSITAVPAASSYITGRFLEMVERDPVLKRFATSSDD